MNAAKVEALVGALLAELGEDPKREGLLGTPARVARALDFLTPVTGVTSPRSSTTRSSCSRPTTW